MSKSQRIEKRINRIEDRFKKKVAKGKKGTDMDIELHERRIKNLKDKSPLEFGFLAGAANAIRSGRGRKKLGKRINKLENQMGVLMRDRNSNEADDSGPEFATGLPGSLDPQANAQPDLMPMNSFSPGAIENANSMFGNEMPGSFDKDMGNPLNKNKK